MFQLSLATCSVLKYNPHLLNPRPSEAFLCCGVHHFTPYANSLACAPCSQVRALRTLQLDASMPRSGIYVHIIAVKNVRQDLGERPSGEASLVVSYEGFEYGYSLKQFQPPNVMCYQELVFDKKTPLVLELISGAYDKRRKKGKTPSRTFFFGVLPLQESCLKGEYREISSQEGDEALLCVYFRRLRTLKHLKADALGIPFQLPNTRFHLERCVYYPGEMVRGFVVLNSNATIIDKEAELRLESVFSTKLKKEPRRTHWCYPFVSHLWTISNATEKEPIMWSFQLRLPERMPVYCHAPEFQSNCYLQFSLGTCVIKQSLMIIPRLDRLKPALCERPGFYDEMQIVEPMGFSIEWATPSIFHLGSSNLVTFSIQHEIEEMMVKDLKVLLRQDLVLTMCKADGSWKALQKSQTLASAVLKNLNLQSGRELDISMELHLGPDLQTPSIPPGTFSEVIETYHTLVVIVTDSRANSMTCDAKPIFCSFPAAASRPIEFIDPTRLQMDERSFLVSQRIDHSELRAAMSPKYDRFSELALQDPFLTPKESELCLSVDSCNFTKPLTDNLHDQHMNVPDSRIGLDKVSHPPVPNHLTLWRLDNPPLDSIQLEPV